MILIQKHFRKWVHHLDDSQNGFEKEFKGGVTKLSLEEICDNILNDFESKK